MPAGGVTALRLVPREQSEHWRYFVADLARQLLEPSHPELQFRRVLDGLRAAAHADAAEEVPLGDQRNADACSAVGGGNPCHIPGLAHGSEVFVFIRGLGRSGVLPALDLPGA